MAWFYQVKYGSLGWLIFLTLWPPEPVSSGDHPLIIIVIQWLRKKHPYLDGHQRTTYLYPIDVGNMFSLSQSRLRYSDSHGTPLQNYFNETSAKIMTLPISYRYSVQPEHVTIFIYFKRSGKDIMISDHITRQRPLLSLGGGFSQSTNQYNSECRIALFRLHHDLHTITTVSTLGHPNSLRWRDVY
jgi:hypothetical protein